MRPSWINAPATDAEARVFRRLFFAQMEAVDIDKAGRVLIPDRLVDFAGLKHEVVLIGVRDHLELWDAQRWQDYLGQHGPRFDAGGRGSFQKRFKESLTPTRGCRSPLA